MFQKSCFAALGLTLLSATTALADMPSREEMWEIIQKQQKQIETLQEQMQVSEKQTARVTETLENTLVNQPLTPSVNQPLTTSTTQQSLKNSNQPLTPINRISQSNSMWNRTSIGGYGELHYNNYLDSANGTDEVDFHRFVLFFGHEFNDSIRFFSELELEHSLSGDGAPGEVELEQAFIQFDLNDKHLLQTGLFLIPVGIMNETHEPTTFYGVERNPVEKNIIPTTWWEAGVGLRGELGGGFSYATAVHSGLNTPTTGSNAFKIRNGRQKVAEAVAEDGAVSAAVSYTGIPGMNLGVFAQYQSDITQDSFSESISATLLEAHADIRRGPWGFRALYARWDLDGTAPKTFGRDVQEGFYIEPSYRMDTSIGDFGVFTRYNYFNNEAGDSGLAGNEQWDVGVNYWPHNRVVLKADMAFAEDNTGNHSEIFNLGVGYQF
ncbi:MAG: OprO/OprP family phosphate-selective porin [Alphaproteobacteria bacterium]|nr:OprO/OprP family phosphate-selective porin [Alphaproteobacteria bacterium]